MQIICKSLLSNEIVFAFYVSLSARVSTIGDTFQTSHCAVGPAISAIPNRSAPPLHFQLILLLASICHSLVSQQTVTEDCREQKRSKENVTDNKSHFQSSNIYNTSLSVDSILICVDSRIIND